jgi:hypothetical protein
MTTAPVLTSHAYAADTAFAVQSLSQTYMSIRKTLSAKKASLPNGIFQNTGKNTGDDIESSTGSSAGSNTENNTGNNTGNSIGLEADMPVSSTLKFLEDEIARLLMTLPRPYLTEVAQYVAHTHVQRLASIVLRPGSGTPPFFLSSTEDVSFAIAMGVDAFRIELDLGMMPGHQSLKNDFRRLLSLCEPEEAEGWRTQTRRLVLRRPKKFIPVILWYVLRRQTDKQPIRRPLSVFLADLLTEIVKEHPDLGLEACENAINGSSTYNLGALILAGARLPLDKHPIPHGGPKVRALANVCKSAHGRLKFIQVFGPLDRYLEVGLAPDYTKS